MIVAFRLNVIVVVFVLSCAPGLATTIQFNYSKDSGFFDPGLARDSLVAAGQVMDAMLTDPLDAILPSGGNNWIASFDDPSTGAPTTVVGLDVPADTLVIYVGARDLTGAAIGLGGPGGQTSFGSNAWNDTVENRGQGTTTGASADDFGPWGGMIAVDDQVNWNLNHKLLPSSGQNDLFSVLLHELGHVLGIGTADSWFNQTSGTTFSGSASVAAHGGPVSLASSQAHWANGTQSTIPGTLLLQDAALDPSIGVGTRKLLTQLDIAGLEDVGWAVIPEPGTGVMTLVAALSLLAANRRRCARHKV